MTINIDAKTWIRYPAQVSGGRFYSDVDKVPASGLVDGQTITLNGSGFGAVAQPLPVGEETFDQYADGLSGTLISALPSARFNVESSPYAVDYMLTDAVKLPGRKYGAVQSAAGSAHTSTMIPVNGSFATHSNYATFWWRANEIITPPTQPSTGSNKFLRIWDDFASGSGTRVSLTTQQNGTGGGGQFYSYRYSVSGTPDVDEWWDDTPLHQAPNVWRRFEVYVDGNTGAAWFNIDGKRIKTSTAFQKDPAYLGTVLQPALFGYDVGNSSVTSTLRTYLADLFSTQTAARVELSNSATFDQTTYQKRYYQRTLTRTDGQIQFELFLGDLDVGNLYAHVLNSQGAHIATIAVTGATNP